MVVGNYSTSSGSRAFSWTASGGLRDLGTLGGSSSNARGINNNGVVVGESATTSGVEHAFSWTSSGGMRDLATPGGRRSVAFDITDSGIVTGNGDTSSGQWLPFVLGASGGMQKLSLGGTSATIDAVTESGFVIGGSSDTTGAYKDYVWNQEDGIRALPTLATNYTYGEAVNEAGFIVGSSGNRAVAWVPSGNLKQNQSITLTSTPPANAGVGGSYTVSATASSGLTVSFASATTGVCTVFNRTVSLVAAGTCTVSASQSGNSAYNPAPNVSQSFSVGAPTTTPATYTVNFSGLSAGRIISSVSLGSGVSSSSGTASGTVAVYGKRSGLSGNMAKVMASARHLIIAKNSSSTSSYASGGYIEFRFGSFGSGRATIKSLRVKNTTKTGGTVALCQRSTLLKSVSVPQTGSGSSRLLTLNVAGADRVRVNLTGPGAVDDLVLKQ